MIYLRAFFYLTFDLAFTQCYFCGIFVNDFVQFTHIWAILDFRNDSIQVEEYSLQIRYELLDHWLLIDFQNPVFQFSIRVIKSIHSQISLIDLHNLKSRRRQSFAIMEELFEIELNVFHSDQFIFYLLLIGPNKYLRQMLDLF